MHLQRDALLCGEVEAQDGVRRARLAPAVPVDVVAEPVERLVEGPHPVGEPCTGRDVVVRHAARLERPLQLLGQPLLRERGGRAPEQVRHQLQPLALGPAAPHNGKCRVRAR